MITLYEVITEEKSSDELGKFPISAFKYPEKVKKSDIKEKIKKNIIVNGKKTQLTFIKTTGNILIPQSISISKKNEKKEK